jgi:hydrogenase maturation protease
VLVVGYGNQLRGDDGIGWHAVSRLADDRRLEGARVAWQQQLTPELADDFARAWLVVLVDAQVGPEPGVVAVRRLAPASGSRAPMTHHVAPEHLLGLARELYGSAPEAWVVGVGAAGMEVGDGLSPAVEAAIPSVVEAVAAIVREHVDA